MPVIASRTFTIRVNDDNTVDLLTELKEKGCIQLQEASERISKPIEEVKRVVRALVGEVVCDSEVCCVNRDTYREFVEKMKRLRGQ